MASVKVYVRKASLTVEAAYITFLTIMVIAAVMMAGFYLHDRSVVRSDMMYLGELTLRSSIKWIDPNTKALLEHDDFSHRLSDSWELRYQANSGQIESGGLQLIQDRMIYTKVQSVQIQCSYNTLLKRLSCTVTVDGRMMLPFSLFGISKFDLHEQCEISEIDAIRYLWQKTVLKGGTDD